MFNVIPAIWTSRFIASFSPQFGYTFSVNFRDGYDGDYQYNNYAGDPPYVGWDATSVSDAGFVDFDASIAATPGMNSVYFWLGQSNGVDWKTDELSHSWTTNDSDTISLGIVIPAYSPSTTLSMYISDTNPSFGESTRCLWDVTTSDGLHCEISIITLNSSNAQMGIISFLSYGSPS